VRFTAQQLLRLRCSGGARITGRPPHIQEDAASQPAEQLAIGSHVNTVPGDAAQEPETRLRNVSAGMPARAM
jgi:hypothetical protein